MKYIVSVVIVAVLFTSVSSRSLKFHICSTKGIECLDQNTYVSCPKSSKVVMEEYQGKKCHPGFVCQEGPFGQNPCVPEPEEEEESDSDQQSTENNAANNLPKGFYLCNKKGFECVNKNTFVYCPKASKIIIEKFQGKKCRQDYVCQEGGFGWFPCVPNPDVDNKPENNKPSTAANVTNNVPKESSTTERQSDTQTTKTVTEENDLESTQKNEVTPEPRPSTTIYVPKESSTTKRQSDTQTTKTVTEGKDLGSTQKNEVTLEPKPSTTTEDEVKCNTEKQIDKSESVTEIDIFETTVNSKTESVTKAENFKSTVNDVTVVEDTKTQSQAPLEEKSTKQDILGSTNAEITAETTTNNSETDTKTDTEKENVDTDVTIGDSKISTIEDVGYVTTENLGNSESGRVSTELVLKTNSKVDPAGLVEHFSQKIPPTPPQCSGSGVLSGPTCQEYYECVSFFWFFYHPELKTCPEGESFSVVESRCVPSAQSDCVD